MKYLLMPRYIHTLIPYIIKLLVIPQIAVFLLFQQPAPNDPVYAWNLVSSETEVMTYGDGKGIPYNDLINPERKVIVHFFGRDSARKNSDPLFQTWNCGSNICAMGIFIYEKNDNIFQPAPGFTYSRANIREMDTAPQLAFTNSSIAFQAMISGFLSEPLVRGAFGTLLAITFASYLFRQFGDIFARELKLEDNRRKSEREDKKGRDDDPD